LNDTFMHSRRRARQKGIALLLMAILAITLVPMVGLAIDAAVLYVVKARVSAACDGASLAAARNLNVGQTMAQQAASAHDRAESFFYANIPSNFLGATRGTPVIDIPTTTTNNVLTVTTSGSATVSTYFMRMLGVNDVVVNATGTASRRNVNLMMVLDRSMSMQQSGSCAPMRAAAKDFVSKFVDGRDKLGLIHFGTNTVLAFPPAANFKSASTNVASIIDGLSCVDSTSMSAAYWRAYQELVNLSEPGALNVIVLFTDGIPNGIDATFDVRTASDTRFGYSGGPCGTGVQCVVPAPAASCRSSAQISGVVAAMGDLNATGDTRGIWISQGPATGSYNQQKVNRSGCSYSSGSNTENRVRADLKFIPDQDNNGNRIRGYSNQYLSFDSSDLAPGFPTQVRIDRPRTITIASSNLVDNAAQRVRGRASDPTLGVVTFVIGLGSVDPVLMRRVANDPLSNIYTDDPELPDGKFLHASDTGEMAEAFQRIASEVLRLSR
jgi:Flp pilus assembly protein TadG